MDSVSGFTRCAVLFVIYQTDRHGPQNGFRICLVQEGFAIGVGEGVETKGAAIQAAEAEVGQGAVEWVVLGQGGGVAQEGGGEEG